MNDTLRYKLSQYWSAVQEELIPQLKEELGPLSVPLLAVVRTLEYVRIEEFVDRRWCGILGWDSHPEFCRLWQRGLVEPSGNNYLARGVHQRH